MASSTTRPIANTRPNSDNVLIDHTWVWRADHGIEGFSGGEFGDTQRWQTNVGRNGVVVNGNDVTATGLFVEHFQQYNTIWNGENGRVILYQNELPYDPPTQAEWSDGSGNGWASYVVADSVQEHHATGMGVYSYFIQPGPILDDAIQAPARPGVRFERMVTRFLNGNGQITHVVNGAGGTVDSSSPTYWLDSYSG